MMSGNIHRRSMLAAPVVAAAALLGCSPGEVPIGYHSSSIEDIADSWVGYVENHHFESGSDAIRIDLVASGATLTGTVRFGEPTTFPPVTDPDVGYPPGVDFTHDDKSSFFEGFEFTVLDPQLTDTRLQLWLTRSEVWKEWCEVQTSYNQFPDNPDGVYGCLPNEGYGYDPENGCMSGDQPVDCGTLYLCAMSIPSTCECHEDGCTAAPTPRLDIDITFVDDGAHGSVLGIPGAFNVWLTREE